LQKKRDANETENGEARQKQTRFANTHMVYACRHCCRQHYIYNRGRNPVEYLSPGHKVVTRDPGAVTLLFTFVHRISAQAVTTKAGSVEHTRPDHNVIIPAEQNILVRGWRARSMFGKAQTIVQAEDLIDGEFITDMGARDLHLMHLTFGKQHVIYAETTCYLCRWFGNIRSTGKRSIRNSGLITKTRRNAKPLNGALRLLRNPSPMPLAKQLNN
jgi:hypothetical protein